jgi:hypothetical protein
MRPWALWLIEHHLAWLLRTIVVLSYPLILLAYCKDAAEDVTYTMKSIDYEVMKADLNK